jgi:hypothetical protein
VYELFYRDIHGSAHVNIGVSYKFIPGNRKDPRIWPQPVVRRYRKMCSRFETGAHIGRTICTLKNYVKIVFGIGTRSLQQFHAKARDRRYHPNYIDAFRALFGDPECEIYPKS